MNQLQMLKRAMISYVTNSAKAIWSAIAHPLTIVSTKECNVKDYKIYGGGENILDVESTWSGYANDEGGISYTNADFATVGGREIKCDWKENTQYTFSFNYEIETSAENRLMIVIKHSDGTQTYRYITPDYVVGLAKGLFAYTTQENSTVQSMQVWYQHYDVETSVKLTNMRLEEYTEINSIPITIRGKNYFDLDEIPSSSTTIRYNNGLTAKKTEATNRGNKIPITLPIGKEIKMTMEVVDSQINGTTERVTMGFYNSKNTLVRSTNVTSTKAKKSYTFTLSEEVSYIQFYFQYASASNAVGDYVTMDNIMLRCEGDDTYEHYIEPQTVVVEANLGAGEVIQKSKDGLPNLPQFNGTTTYEVLTDTPPSGIEVCYY